MVPVGRAVPGPVLGYCQGQQPYRCWAGYCGRPRSRCRGRCAGEGGSPLPVPAARGGAGGSTAMGGRCWCRYGAVGGCRCRSRCWGRCRCPGLRSPVPQVQEIVFRNFYTAFLSVRVQRPGPGGSRRWVTCLRDHRLMPCPHTEEGSQDYFSLHRHQVSAPGRRPCHRPHPWGSPLFVHTPGHLPVPGSLCHCPTVPPRCLSCPCQPLAAARVPVAVLPVPCSAQTASVRWHFPRAPSTWGRVGFFWRESPKLPGSSGSPCSVGSPGPAPADAV